MGPPSQRQQPTPYYRQVYQEPQQAVVVGQPQPYGAPLAQQHDEAHPGQQHVAPLHPSQTPAEGGWMPQQPMVANCPPGLEYLTQIDQILVHQQVELLEMLSDFEFENKYIVKNSLGQKVFFAAEQSSCLQRNCCKSLRHFEMLITDNFGREVIHLHRPLACDSCLYPCCLQKMEVSSPPGTVIGTIEQQWSIFPEFKVKDAAGDVILRIKGPLFPCSCCGTDVNFEVFAKDGETKVGKISKQWTGFVNEMATDADNFGINFPMDLDVKMKAVLLGACFLIDFMYFEKNSKTN